MKSEGESRFENGLDMRFSLDDLKNAPNQTTAWGENICLEFLSVNLQCLIHVTEGVRNIVASRHLRSMKQNDLCFFYHSNCKRPGCVALVRVASEPYPDPTAFDPSSPYYDSKSSRDQPKWFLVRT